MSPNGQKRTFIVDLQNMLGTVLLSNPPQFATFELAHRITAGEHRFEVAYGLSFNELYYDFSPSEFVRSLDRQELELQLKRAGQDWLLLLLDDLANGRTSVSAQDVIAMAQR